MATGQPEPRPEDQAVEAWKRSSDRRFVFVLYLIGGILAYILAAGAVLIGSGAIEEYETRYGVAAALGAASVAALAGALFGLAAARRRFVERYVRRVADQAADELTGTADLLALMKVNRRQMDAYDVIARYQAASSYRNSQVAMAIGLAVLVLGAVVTIAADNTATKVATASLTAVGGLLSGYIGQTFLKTYSTTLAQLNFYFQQPLINSYVLMAERIARGMEPTKRDEVLVQVVRGVIDELVRHFPITEHTPRRGSRRAAAGNTETPPPST